MNYPYYPNQMMGQMPMVNPMYMNQGYYNFQQVNPQLGGGSGTFSNNYQGGGSYYQKNKRQMGKPNKYGNQNFNKPYQKLDIQSNLE